MKLSDLKPQSNKVILLHPISGNALKTDDGDIVEIEVVGRDSREFYAYQREAHRKIREQHAKSLNSGGELPPDMYEDLVIENILACIIGWEAKINPFFAPFDVTKGKGKFTKRLAKLVLTDPDLQWVRDQIDSYITERAHFFVK